MILIYVLHFKQQAFFIHTQNNSKNYCLQITCRPVLYKIFFISKYESSDTKMSVTQMYLEEKRSSDDRHVGQQPDGYKLSCPSQSRFSFLPEIICYIFCEPAVDFVTVVETK